MKRIALLFLIASACLFACATPRSAPSQAASASSVPESFFAGADGSLVHKPSNTVFPLKLGDFTRAGAQAIDKAGSFVGIGYMTRYPVNVTVMVFLSPATDIDADFADAKYAIASAHEDAVLVKEGDASLSGNEGRYAFFQFEDSFAGSTTLIVSPLYIYEAKGWFVKFRVSYAKEDEATAKLALEDFFFAFSFPSKQRS